eukprot:TRINITY_DN17872_c1_g5_i1.p1 TRINITY_DN17872_c1_g5~~TRINITY_DN17872_c1_g5_i1.p1  ORF type:complete len:501 (-),score=102.97 TRINITY_DN17872_c1_g5_i1:67-1569(-)
MTSLVRPPVGHHAKAHDHGRRPSHERAHSHEHNRDSRQSICHPHLPTEVHHSGGLGVFGQHAEVGGEARQATVPRQPSKRAPSKPRAPSLSRASEDHGRHPVHGHRASFTGGGGHRDGGGLLNRFAAPAAAAVPAPAAASSQGADGGGESRRPVVDESCTLKSLSSTLSKLEEDRLRSEGLFHSMGTTAKAVAKFKHGVHHGDHAEDQNAGASAGAGVGAGAGDANGAGKSAGDGAGPGGDGGGALGHEVCDAPALVVPDGKDAEAPQLDGRALSPMPDAEPEPDPPAAAAGAGDASAAERGRRSSRGSAGDLGGSRTGRSQSKGRSGSRSASKRRSSGTKAKSKRKSRSGASEDDETDEEFGLVTDRLISDEEVDEFLEALFAEYCRGTTDNRGRPLMNNPALRIFFRDFCTRSGGENDYIVQADMKYDEEIERQTDLHCRYDLSKAEAKRGLCFDTFQITLYGLMSKGMSRRVARGWFDVYAGSAQKMREHCADVHDD